MGRKIDEHDEFLLSRLLDGDLSADESSALREQMEQEPALGEAYESLKRVDEALLRQYADEPVVDWRRFRQEIAVAVKSQLDAQPRKISLAGWFRIGVPLAAAAAIALLISLYPESSQPTKLDKVTQPINVVYTGPEAKEAGKLVVRFNRPGLQDDGQASVIRVTYGRSAQVADSFRQMDEAARNGLSYVAIAAVPQPPSVQEDLFEIPPL